MFAWYWTQATFKPLHIESMGHKSAYNKSQERVDVIYGYLLINGQKLNYISEISNMVIPYIALLV